MARWLQSPTLLPLGCLSVISAPVTHEGMKASSVHSCNVESSALELQGDDCLAGRGVFGRVEFRSDV